MLNTINILKNVDSSIVLELTSSYLQGKYNSLRVELDALISSKAPEYQSLECYFSRPMYWDMGLHGVSRCLVHLLNEATSYYFKDIIDTHLIDYLEVNYIVGA